MDIQGLANATFKSAKKITECRSKVRLIMFAFAICSIFVEGKILWVLAILSMFAEAYTWYLLLKINSKKNLAHEFIRINIIQKAFGRKMPMDLSYLKAQVDDKELEKAEAFDEPNYYASKNENPKIKLVEILQESCFWTQHLYKASLEKSTSTALILFTFILITVIGFLSLVSPDENYGLARALMLLLMFAPLWDQIEKIVIFNSASSKLKLIDLNLKFKGKETDYVLFIFADYNAVISNAPLISDAIYEQEKPKLEKLWAERIA